MTLGEFTNRLQDLCHHGHAADAVTFEGIDPEKMAIRLESPEGNVAKLSLFQK